MMVMLRHVENTMQTGIVLQARSQPAGKNFGGNSVRITLMRMETTPAPEGQNMSPLLNSLSRNFTTRPVRKRRYS